MHQIVTAKNQNVIHQVFAGRCNVFIVTGGKSFILIDASVAKYKIELFEAIDSFIREGYAFQGLVVTHCHFDHVINVYAAKQKYKMHIYVHAREKDFLAGGKSPAMIGTNPLLKVITTSFQKPLQAFARYKAAEPDITVENDNFNLNSLGINTYLLHTPGHSPGSMSVIVDNEIALVGDNMVGMFKGSLYPPFAEDPKLLIKSWEKLLDTGCRLFIPSHGKASTRDTLLRQYQALQ